MNSGKGKFLAKYKTFLLSTGSLSLDCLLNGGLATNTITLLEEDKLNIHCSLLCQHFIAHGLSNNQDTALVIDEISPEEFIQNLPKLNPDNSLVPRIENDMSQLNIAWRYRDLAPVKDDFAMSNNGSSKVDLTKFSSYSFHNINLSDNLNETLTFCKKFIKEKGSFRKQLKLVISSLGSPLWGICENEEKFLNLISRFLFCLKAIVSESTISVIVTINPDLLESNVIEIVRSMCNYVLKFEAFDDPKAVADQLHNDVSGQIRPIKIASVNSIEPIFRPNTSIWSYHIHRRKMLFKEFCLPPCLSDNTSRSNQNEPSRSINLKSGCGVDF